MLGMIGGASQVSATAPGAAAYSLARKAGWATPLGGPDLLKYGVSFRFRVILDGVNTGDWSTCSGLKVDFKPEQLKSGGNYTDPRWMPGEASYPRIVLRRAIDGSGSQKVQDWLKAQAWNWMGAPYDPDEAGGSAVVVLYDADNDAVMQWRIRGVRPASWSGPDLDTSAGKVALEVLELVHGGFDVDGNGVSRPLTKKEEKPQTLTIAPTNTKLGAEIKFPLNPETVVFSYSAGGSTEMRGKPGEGEGDAGGGFVAHSTPAGVCIYAITGLNLFHTTARDVNKQATDLLSWVTSKDKKNTEDDHKVFVTWGEFLTKKPMRLTDVKITFTRFLENGKPVRAKVTTLNMEQWPEEEAAGAANPSSGGVAGRRTHRLTEGESLASLSQHYYDTGLRWREIAEANDVDDPSRLRPGTMLYLPAPAEVSDIRNG